MDRLQRVIVVLLVLTLIFSAASIVFNIAIVKTSPTEGSFIRDRPSSNSGNLGFIVEGLEEGGEGG